MLFYEIDATEHAWQRKLLAPGFSATALRKQEHLIHQYVNLFVQKMGSLSAASHGVGVDVAEVMLWLGFDIMGSSLFLVLLPSNALEGSSSSFFLSSQLGYCKKKRN